MNNKYSDIKNRSYEELKQTADDLRNDILASVSKNGGHLASNLGVVELTLALHRVFDLPEDKIIFDVSHQCYVHKILSGRFDEFQNLRNSGGASGFQCRNESEYDYFGGGHSGTSISAALGFAQAQRLCGGKRYAVAVVGDGSFTNGMIYEALNNASGSDLNLVVIINDNNMSISQNVGAMSKYFGRLRTSVRYFSFKRRFKSGLSKLKILGRPIAFISKKIKELAKRLLFKTNLFEHLGINYIGPVDGHDIKRLEGVLKEAKLLGRPVIVHVCTTKGKGYPFAENDPDIYHSVRPFDLKNGIVKNSADSSFSSVFGNALMRYAEKDEKVVAVCAAMADGTGLNNFSSVFPNRFYDVGIAEEHAVTFSASLAAAGQKPVFAVYSSFLQRGYDQIIHDVAIQELGVVFAIDRAGFVDGDGMTHQGIFDCGIFLSVPGSVIYTPETYDELDAALKEALDSKKLSVVRYPKGCMSEYDRSVFIEEEYLKYFTCGKGKKVTLVTYGVSAKNIVDAAYALKDEYEVTVVVLKRVKPLEREKIWRFFEEAELVIFEEEHIKNGGVSQHIISELAQIGKSIKRAQIFGVDETFPSHASVQELYKTFGLDACSIVKTVKNTIK